ncbi:peptidase family S41 [Klosneuvirus KNV1]|uniref:Peptidase family S41 n=1 Tax=Klosneuvirus KNV1 TaxID=1977640 RepID=A0A1V0SJG8_9VIRU|nr:peptidase family S41 [Klosneuvirus KNV1]
MTNEYHKIINKVYNIIKKEGIPYYLDKWKKPLIPENFESYEDFLYFLYKYVQSYHTHSFVYSISKTEKYNKQNISQNNERQMPAFKYDERTKIGTITYYQFINDYNNEKKTMNDYKKLIKLVQATYQSWNQKGLNGLIIDLRKHTGGNMWPAVESLQDILGDTSLLSFTNVKSKFSDKKWINIQNGKIMKKDDKLVTAKIKFDNPIAVIVSQNTASSGEFITGIFYGRNNVKIFGDKTNKTAGFFSVNKTIKINDDLIFNLTNKLCTTVDGTFHVDEVIYVDKTTNSPIGDAKDWIMNNRID